MSLELPSKSEVLGWSPVQLADFLKRMDLPGSDKIVLKNMMAGARFLDMSDNDLQRFPKIHAPLISKLCSEINKKEERRGLFGKRSTGPRYPDAGNLRVSAADHQAGNHQAGNHGACGFSDSQAGWGEDEFEDSDDCEDYENPDADEDGGADYEDPTDDGFAVGGGGFDGGDDSDNDYEPPPTEPPEDLSRPLRPSLPLPDGDYIDNRNRSVFSREQPVVTPRPPEPILPPSSRPPVEPSPPFSAAPPVFREKKRFLGQQFNTDERVAQPSWRPSASPLPSASVSRSNSSVRTPPWSVPEARMEEDMPTKHHTFPLPTPHNKELPARPLPSGPSFRNAASLPPSLPDTNSANSLPKRLMSVMSSVHRRGSSIGDRALARPSPPTPLPPPTDSTQGMDRSWYVGSVTRRHAEHCLKQGNTDGAYVVRDSRVPTDEQPYTLMVVYQGRVFNIQIQKQGPHYLLGTGLKIQESFTSVSDIISHYSQNVLLINANSQGGQPNYTQLSEPAGHWCH